jgi:hypothetical protein
MERNVEIVRASKEVADGAAMLTTRCLDLAGDRTRRPQGACHLDLRVDGGTKAAQRGGAKPGQVAAWARHLAGKPRVARLRNGDQTGTILAEQHHSFSSIARTTAMHQGETAVAAKNFGRHRE